MKILDLGGTVQHWKVGPLKPATVVVVNLDRESSDVPWITAAPGDACKLPEEVQKIKFDLVYSNSTIEHVGGHSRRCDFANVVREMAPHHWIQTPYRYFPIEPHWLFPGLQFMPQRLRALAIRWWPLSPARPTPDQALRDVLEVELVSIAEMEYYFPSSQVLRELVFGLPKSIIAVRGAR